MLQRQSQSTHQSQWRQHLTKWGLVAEAAIATTVVSVFVSASPGLFGPQEATKVAKASPDAGTAQLIAIHLPVGTANATANDPRKNFKRGMRTLERDVNTVVHRLTKNLDQK